MSFLDFVKSQRQHVPIVPTPSDCNGGTYIVIGANTGLGYECVKHLVRLSAVRVIMGVRSLSKGDAAKAQIEAETGIKGVAEVWHIDLTSYDSVKEFADRVKRLDRVDGVVENAAIAMANQTFSEGLETSLTVNVISTLLLAVLVLPKLQESAKKYGISPRLAAVGSGVAFSVKGELEKSNGDVLDAVSADGGNMSKRYPVSKLLELYAIRQLALLRPVSETGVTINYVNPGFCKTELSRNAGFILWAILGIMKIFLGRTAEVGSRTLLHAGVAAGKDSHGKYVSECEIKEGQVAPWVTDDAGAKMQNRVWESVSKKLNIIQPGCI
ncbi:NAD(P)-binding protein [Melanomma pulvis-pyrius CBS 109.77]|uniref:NAD(P)-binding protein n=1 Tax=Melanomma pulvis-pyrius CBS 109.77 TaxID=1314802 RepID=A0A6A6X5X3_9PLEO|nr:NAD(P)-binding protein [Melanomma pulvis-pyrius CBS 109.77]